MYRYFLYIFLIYLNYYSDNSCKTISNNQDITTCRIDLNQDGKEDIAILNDVKDIQELVILINDTSGYKSFLVTNNGNKMKLICCYGDYVVQTAAGKGDKNVKTYKTPGTYIKLYQPEGASVVYFWNGDGFTEVWVSD